MQLNLYPGATRCTPCSRCDANARQVSSCDGSADTVCACNDGYYSLNDGKSCNICKTSCADSAAVVVSACSPTSNLICGIVTNCQSAAGKVSECISPQTCFSCSAQVQHSSSTSVGITGSQGINSGSLTGGNTASSSASIQVGICCATSDPTQNCAQYCKTSLGNHTLSPNGWLYVPITIAGILSFSRKSFNHQIFS